MYDPEVGVRGSDHPAQNPPPLDGLAQLAFRFYRRTASLTFVRDWGLTAWRMERLGLEGKALEMFEDMIELMHRAAAGIPPTGEE